MFNRLLDNIISKISRNPSAFSSPQHSTPPTLHRRGLLANKRQLLLFALILLPILAAFTQSIAYQIDHWNPTVRRAGEIYVATHDQ